MRPEELKEGQEKVSKLYRINVLKGNLFGMGVEKIRSQGAKPDILKDGRKLRGSKINLASK